MPQKLIIFIIALGLLGGLAFLVFKKSSGDLGTSPNLSLSARGGSALGGERRGTKTSLSEDMGREKLAQCLKDKNVVMYGAAWCGHCQNQKKLFGESFSLVPYVECPDNIQQCLDLRIDGYPTWIWPDGTRLEGEQSLETLAEKSGCSY